MVRIPKLEAIRRIQAKNWIDSRLASLKKTNPYFHFKYEAFNENQNKIITDGLKFLNCDPKKLHGSELFLKKQSKGIVSNYVKNYDELFFSLSQKKMLISHINET